MRSGQISASGTNTLVSTAAYDIPDDILFTLGDGSDIAQVLSSGAITADATLTGVIEGTARHLATAANSLLISNITDDGDIQFLVSDGGHSWGILTFNANDHSAHFGQNDYGVDVRMWGATANHYLVWDESEDDLVLVGVSSTFSVDSTVNSTSSITGSIHTDGGLGVALNTFLAGTLTTGAVTLTGELDCGANSAGFTQQTATGDSTTTVDWTSGNKFYFTFGAYNETFTFTAPSKSCNLLLVLKQDGVGSRTATFPGTVLWPGGVAPTLSTTAAKVDIISFYYDGTNYFGTYSLDFA